jgi:D-galactarolactone cycloisomerase
MASAEKLPVHCHSSMGINMVATAHVLSAIENPGYFEADCSVDNPLRDRLVDPPVQVINGMIRPNEGPGLGIEVDEEMILRYPGEAGPAYV